MKWLKIWLAIGLVVVGSSRVIAAEGEGFYVIPPFVEAKIESGREKLSVEIEIGNKSLQEATFEISVVDFGSLDETGGLAFITANSDKNEKKYALASWVTLEKNSLTVLPGKSEKVKMTILNRESLSPGGHYGAVLATVKSSDQGVAETVGINQSLASLIYVLKTGGEVVDLSLNRVEFDKNILKFPETIKLRFWNKGNVHVVPRGTVVIRNNQGKIVSQGIINGDSGKVLPESSRIMELPLKKLGFWNWPGKYILEINYRDEGNDKFTTFKTGVVYVGFEGVLMGVGLVGLLALFWRKFA